MRKITLLIALITFSVMSCKKDNTEDLVSPPDGSGAAIIAGSKSCLLTKLGYDNSYYETFEYDSKNRPVKENYFENGVADGYLKFTYNGNDITQEYYNKNNVKEDVYTFKLGSNGYISSAVYSYTYLDGGFSYTDTENSTLTYNTEGYLVKVVSTEVTTSNKPGYVSSKETNSSTYIYSNGNLLSSEQKIGSDTYTTKYEYYTDKPNNLQVGDDEILNFLLGKRSINLLKKETESSTSSASYINSYTYTFNADGLISKQVKSSSGSNISTYTFDYACK